MKGISIDYYILNVKILPPNNESGNRYEQLILNWFKSGYRPKVKGDKNHYYGLRKLDKIGDNGKAYYGVLSRYIDLNEINFRNNDTGRLIPNPVPNNVEGVVNEHEFIFLPQYHRFAFIQKGKINSEVEKKGRPSIKKMMDVIKQTFDSGLDVGEEAVIEMVQEKYIFEEFFKYPLLSLEIRVSYTNDDLNEEAKEFVDERLKNGNIAKLWSKFTPDNTGEINTKEHLVKGLLELAGENGSAKGRVRTEEGIKNISSEEHPEIITEFTENESQRELALFTKIINRFKKRYERKENGE